MPPLVPLHPAEALPSSLLLLQVVTDHGLTWNFAAWSLSVEWISYLLFPLLIPSPSPAAAGATSPPCWP